MRSLERDDLGHSKLNGFLHQPEKSVPVPRADRQNQLGGMRLLSAVPISTGHYVGLNQTPCPHQAGAIEDFDRLSHPCAADPEMM